MRAYYTSWIISALVALYFQASAKGEDLLVPIAAPPVLYHWTSFADLGAMAKKIDPENPILFFGELKLESVFVRSFPLVRKRSGLFAWINPVTGMGSGPSEIYGNGECLIKIYVDSKEARAAKAEYKFPENSTLDVGKYDIILHKSGEFQEWAILNPHVIFDFTADPKALETDLRLEISRLKNPDFLYPIDLLHSNWLNDNRIPKNTPKPIFGHFPPADRQSVIIPRIEKFLRSRDRIPQVFLRNPFQDCMLRNFK